MALEGVGGVWRWAGPKYYAGDIAHSARRWSGGAKHSASMFSPDLLDSRFSNFGGIFIFWQFRRWVIGE